MRKMGLGRWHQQFWAEWCGGGVTVEITAVGDDTALTVHSFSLLPCYICYVRNTININYTTKILMQYHTHTQSTLKKKKSIKKKKLSTVSWQVHTLYQRIVYRACIPAPMSIFFFLPQLFSFFSTVFRLQTSTLVCLHI